MKILNHWLNQSYINIIKQTNTFGLEEQITLYDTRTPRLFKLEYSGDGIIALCSKMYYVGRAFVAKNFFTKMQILFQLMN
jgi:hypothetical protein